MVELQTEVGRVVGAITDVCNDAIEQAFDRLVCEGIEVDRMSSWCAAGWKQGIHVDGRPAFALDGGIERDPDGGRVVFLIRPVWVGAFERLNRPREP